MKCFACDRKLGKNPKVADTRDDQWVYVGRECYKHILAAGSVGWQPPKGGPRLFILDNAARLVYAASNVPTPPG